MGRRVKVRVNYNQDATFLLRLQTAVMEDPKASDAFKKYIYKRIQDIVDAFHVSPETFNTMVGDE